MKLLYRIVLYVLTMCIFNIFIYSIGIYYAHIDMYTYIYAYIYWEASFSFHTLTKVPFFPPLPPYISVFVV